MLETDMTAHQRDAQIVTFLTSAGWEEAARIPLAGDASSRRYERLMRQDGQTAVLMDAPPDMAEPIRPFLTIAEHLSSLGLSAPEVFTTDKREGLILMEDLGDDLIARCVAKNPTLEPMLYQAAADVLVTLRENPTPPALPVLNAATLPPLVAPMFDWYYLGASADASGCQDTCKALSEAIERHAATRTPVFIYRDYHAENLIWLPERNGVARVGLLDFQDAHKGHPAYDLVSLLEDARRDVHPETRDQTLKHYLAKTGDTETKLSAALAVLGAQRNMRILGVFARLSMHFGKSQYIDLIPRVWGYLMQNLSHPALADVTKVVSPPEPTPKTLQRLKDLCGTVPTP